MESRILSHSLIATSASENEERVCYQMLFRAEFTLSEYLGGTY